MPRHLRKLLDLNREETEYLLKEAKRFKDGKRLPKHPSRVVGLLFEKPSTRTRVSFEVAAFKLSASSIYLNAQETQLSRGESLRDTARVLSRYLDAIVFRTFLQENLEELASTSRVPVINGLSDRFHPCQSLADLLTIEENFGDLDGKVIAFLGDGNNVFNSLAEGTVLFPYTLRFSGPREYEPDPELIATLRKMGGRIEISSDPIEGVRGADVLYTDVWVSMGQEKEAEERKKKLSPYRITLDLLNRAPSHAIVLHCLPAHRGMEITDEVMDHPRSRVFDQAENRMWAQMALLHLLWSQE